MQNVYVQRPEPQRQSLTPSDGSMGLGQPLAPNDMDDKVESVERREFARMAVEWVLVQEQAMASESTLA